MTMKIAVVGAGSIGGVIAWHLARAGHAPVVVGRASGIAEIATNGLTVTSPAGSETVHVVTSTRPEDVGACDVVLAGFKANDWPLAAAFVRPLLGPDTLLVPLLNGIPWWYFDGVEGPLKGKRITSVDPSGLIAQSLPSASIVGSTVYISAARESSSRITWNGRRLMVIGALDAAHSGDVEAFSAVLNAAGLDVKTSDAIRTEIWMKLLGNMFNPLCVITGATMGEIGANSGTRQVLQRAMEEVAAVATAAGIARDFTSDIESRLDVLPANQTFRTSMWSDFEAGRPLELGAIIGSVIEIGRWTEVPTPTLETINALAAARWSATHGPLE